MENFKNWNAKERGDCSARQGPHLKRAMFSDGPATSERLPGPQDKKCRFSPRASCEEEQLGASSSVSENLALWVP